MPHDGSLEHNYVLQQRVKKVKLMRRNLCSAFLNISNAFSALFNAIKTSGLGTDFLDFIKEIY